MSDKEVSFESVEEVPTRGKPAIYPYIIDAFMKQEHKIVIVNVENKKDPHTLAWNIKMHIKLKNLSDKVSCCVRDRKVYLEKLNPARP